MRLYRLGDAAHPIWDGGGAALAGGRWNPVGTPVIYTAGSLALAMIEKLAQRRRFADTLLVEADVPNDLEVEDLMMSPPDGWRDLNSPEALTTGRDWILGKRTALLRVPSAVVPREANYVVNPSHPDAARIRPSIAEPLTWDPRLFGVRWDGA